MDTRIVRPYQTASIAGPRACSAVRLRPEPNVAAWSDFGGVQLDHAPGDEIDQAFYIERAKDLRCAAYRDVMKRASSLILRCLGTKRLI